MDYLCECQPSAGGLKRTQENERAVVKRTGLVCCLRDNSWRKVKAQPFLRLRIGFGETRIPGGSRVLYKSPYPSCLCCA